MNIFILRAFTVILLTAIILSLAELVFRRNSRAGRFVRAVLIRLRELSMTKTVVMSVLLFIVSLIIGDDNHLGVLVMIAMMFELLIIVHPEEFFIFRARRKKAKTKKRAARSKICTKETPLANVMTELVSDIAEPTKG